MRAASNGGIDMANVDGGELLLRVLEQAGIDTLFTLHGGHLDAILQAARDRDIRLIDTRHEQAAGHAADGWARTTGRTGVALVTAGPGFTDCVTAIANAYLDCVPTLFIAGAAPLREAETLPLQGGIDQVAMVTPVKKWAHRVTNTERIPDLAAQALRIASSGRPGPVFLELPIDVLFSRVDEARVRQPAKIVPDAAPAPSPEAVEQAVALLQGAERPAILIGGGAWFSRAGSELVGFAERINAPVFSNAKAHGMMPADHPLCGRGFGNLAAAGRAGSGDADVVLVLGARLGLFTGGRGSRLIPASARIIQIDISAEEIGRNRDVDLAIAADCRESLRALDAAAAEREWPDRPAWLQSIQQVREAHRALFAQALENDKPPIHPYRLAAEIAKALPRDAIIAADGGETASWMDMVAHHELAIVTVVNNDQIWGMSAHGQDLIYGENRRVVTDLAPTRYDLAAQGFGCHAEHVVDPGDLPGALERAFASGKPACVNVMTDPSVIAPVTRSMVGTPQKERPASPESKPKDASIQIPYYEDLKD